MTLSFTSARALSALHAPPPAVRLENPMAEHQNVLRTTLLVGLLEAIRNARRHGERDVRLYTVGPVFLHSDDGHLSDERLRLAFAIAGEETGWLAKPRPLDVWDAKGYAKEIVERLTGRVAEISRGAHGHLHPRGATTIAVDGVEIGSFGPLHPDVVDALELDGEVHVLEIEIGSFTGGRKEPRFIAYPRFPASTRDVALVVRDSVPAGEVEAAVREAAGPFAEAVRLFDRFVGGQVPQGHASLAFRVVYRSSERTLTDAEVDKAHANVVAKAAARFGATLRA
jgi:phenylalanyl-tRNA synthetase beta chain